ncbi:hypothetical protein [Novipirellula sp.]|uniref:hypothetical protein n=1 Tax=Novipirellula sp. TaxID=2795430 RepID=UPI0035683890
MDSHGGQSIFWGQCRRLSGCEPPRAASPSSSRPKEGSNLVDSEGIDNAVDLFDGEDVRRRFVPLQFHRGERLPISLVGSRAKELDT